MLKSEPQRLRFLAIIIVGVAVTGVAIGTYSYLSLIQIPTSDQERSSVEQAQDDIPRRGPIYLSMYKVTTTLPDAEHTVGHKINIPSNIPSGQAIKLVKLIPEENIVAVFIAPADMELDDSTSVDEILQKNGILVLYNRMQPTFDADTWMNSWVEQGSGEFVTVNGIKGVGTEHGPEEWDYSQLQWFYKGIHYNLVSGMPLADLLKTAESIPLDQ